MLTPEWYALPIGGSAVPLPDIGDWSIQPVAGSKGSITFDYPVNGAGYDTLAATVSNDTDIEVEIRLGGLGNTVVRGLILGSSRDDVAEGGHRSFVGHLLEHRMYEGVLHPNPDDTKGETTFGAANAGQILINLMGKAQARGALSDIGYSSFSATTDSNGQLWNVVTTLTLSPGQTYGEILEELEELSLCEWEIDSNRQLRLYKFGTRGTDRTIGSTPIVLQGGRDLLDAPTTHSVEAAPTALLVSGREGLYNSQSSATAQARRGRRIESYASANNIEDAGALTAFAQVKLTAVTPGILEISHGIAMVPGSPVPFDDFRLGDWVLSDTRGFAERRRVQQITLSRSGDDLTAGAVVGTLTTEAVTRLHRRLKAIESGSAVVGTSTPPVDDGKAPMAPSGVVVNSAAYQEGIDTYATLIVDWADVTSNADGTVATDIAGYRVEWRLLNGPAGGWRQGADVSASSASFGGVGAGIDVAVRVAAYDSSGLVSAWSTEVTHLTQNDTTPPPAPSTPVVTAYLGQLKIGWDGKGSAGEAMPLDLDFVEVHVSTTSNFTPSATTLVDQFSTVSGERIVTDRPYGVTQFVRLVSADRTRPISNKSAPSVQGSATPSEIGYADIAFTQVGNLVEDGSFELPGSRATHGARSNPAWGFVNTGAEHGDWCAVGTGAVGSGVRLLSLGKLSAVATQQFVFRLVLKRAANANGDLIVRARFHLDDGTTTDAQVTYTVTETADTWLVKTPSYYTAPAQTVAVEVMIGLGSNMTAGSWSVDRVEFREAIGTLLVQNAAITNAKVVSLDVGKITAGTLTVAVTNAGIIRTGSRPTGQGTEQDAAGFRAYNAAGSQTLGLTGEFNFIMGELRTGSTGTRLVINPGGTDPDEVRFYPSSGSAFAKIETRTFSGQALIDMIGGTTRSDLKTGQAGCHPLEGYVRWGAPESVVPHSYFVANEFATETTGPQLDFIVEQRYGNALSDLRKMTFQLTNSSGTGIANSQLWLRWGGINQPWLARVNGNCGILFDTNQISIVNGSGNYGPVAASAFPLNSSAVLKDSIDDARALLDPLQVIRTARAVTYKYVADRMRAPSPTKADPNPARVAVPDADVPVRFGVIAEQLPAVLRHPMPQADGSVGIGVDLASQVGVLWGAVAQLADRLDQLKK